VGNSSSPGRSTSGPSVSLYRRFVVEESRITRDWPIHAAESFRPLGTEARPFKLICLSGDFVDQNERGRGLYVNIKGRLEKDLFGMEGPGLRTICLRAGGIIPTKEVCVQPLFMLMGSIDWARADGRTACSDDVGHEEDEPPLRRAIPGEVLVSNSDHFDRSRDCRAQAGHFRDWMGYENG